MLRILCLTSNIGMLDESPQLFIYKCEFYIHMCFWLGHIHAKQNLMSHFQFSHDYKYWGHQHVIYQCNIQRLDVQEGPHQLVEHMSLDFWHHETSLSNGIHKFIIYEYHGLSLFIYKCEFYIQICLWIDLPIAILRSLTCALWV